MNDVAAIAVKFHIFKGQIDNFHMDLSGKFLEILGSKCKNSKDECAKKLWEIGVKFIF